MRLTILGKHWNLRFTRNLKNRGDCDPPAAPGKEIRVESSLRDEERLEVVLHEMLHAAGWHIAEEFVDQFACDAARALWRLGYREQRRN